MQDRCDDVTRGERLYEWRVQWWTKLAALAQRLLRPGTLLVSLVVAIYGAGSLSNNRDWPEKSDWQAGTFLSDALVITGVMSIVGYACVAWGYSRMLKRRENDERLTSACRTVARLVAQASSIPHTDIGSHIWVVTGPPGARYLARRATFLPEGRRRSRVTWRRGKGVIGYCWKENRPKPGNIALVERIGTTPERFCQIKKEKRFGLSWDEFQRTKQYRAIWATPLRAGPEGGARFRGCLSIDVQTEDKYDELLAVVKEKQVQDLGRVLEICEGVLDGE